jgi:D-ribose pyranose/furanose isomerase RbsD
MGLAYQETKSMALSMIVPLVCYVAVAVFAFVGAHAAPFPMRWERKLKHLVPDFGHRNWIVVADSAYPAQSNPGIETWSTGEDHIAVLEKIVRLINESGHVRANIYMDGELDRVSEHDAPGVTDLKKALDRVLSGQNARFLPHEQIIAKLDQNAKFFRIAIFKSNLAIPYTSVFLELDCGYWNENAEKRLRDSLENSGTDA